MKRKQSSWSLKFRVPHCEHALSKPFLVVIFHFLFDGELMSVFIHERRRENDRGYGGCHFPFLFFFQLCAIYRRESSTRRMSDFESICIRIDRTILLNPTWKLSFGTQNIETM